MTAVVLVAKYDEAARRGEVEDWTSNDDIGSRFAGEVLSAAEYYRVEERYLGFVRSLAISCGVTEFVVRTPMVAKSPPPWVPPLRSGLVVDPETALKLVRRMLRIGDFSCVLCGGDDLTVGVETDFYLSVQADEDGVAESARRFGLHLYEAGWSWFESDDDVPVLGEFDDRLARKALQSAGRPVVALERWANGPRGERWHLVDGAESLGWIRRLPPGVAVAALPEVRIKWVPRRDVVADAGVDEPVVVVARPEPGAGSALEAVVFLDGVREDDLPLGGELGWFAYPDFRGSLAGVIPDPEGRVDALWDGDLTLIR
ncbi:hypothetical protein [Amycolatopsis kentuckyensis]|uniref:hypothetical protein n=1 Tax=Amycolatopsis kentuckyensis TaxID=218823 RepID=UPI00356AD8B3